MPSRRTEYLEATRRDLVSAARRCFGEQGYAATSLTEIAAEARVTTGAVYHHFKNKRALFQETAEAIEDQLLREAGNDGEGGDLWKQLKAGFQQMVTWCAAPDVQRILFVEAPQVIGPEEWREIELRYAYGAMSKALKQLVRDGVVRPYPVDFMARVLLGLLREASAQLTTDSRPTTRAQVDDLVERVFESLRAESKSSQ